MATVKAGHCQSLGSGTSATRPRPRALQSSSTRPETIRKQRKRPPQVPIWFLLPETKTPILPITMIPTTPDPRRNGYVSVNFGHFSQREGSRTAEQSDLNKTNQRRECISPAHLSLCTKGICPSDVVHRFLHFFLFLCAYRSAFCFSFLSF